MLGWRFLGLEQALPSLVREAAECWRTPGYITAISVLTFDCDWCDSSVIPGTLLSY